MSYSPDSSPSILSQLSADDVLPRTSSALDEIYQAAVLKNARTILVIGRPQSGKTELIRLAYDRFFNEQGRTLPVFFSLRRDRLSPEKFARDFMLTILRHFLAFTNRDADMVARSELTERDIFHLASATEYALFKDVTEGYEDRVRDGDLRSLVRYVLGIPQRLAARCPYHITVLLDEAQWLDRIITDEEIASLLGEVLQQPHLVTFVLTGQQRPLLDQLAAEEGVTGAIKLLHFETPDIFSLQGLVKQWCEQENAAFDPEIGRIAIHQLDSNLFYLRALTAAASERKMWFNKGADFERLYVAELLQGRIAHYYSRLLRQIAIEATKGQANELAAIEIVYICAEALASRAPIEQIKARLEPRINVMSLLVELHRHELITLLDGHILPSEDPVFCDWVAATHRRFEGAGLDEVKLDLLRRRIKGVPQMLALSARHTLHTQIEKLLRRFDGQSVAHSLFAHDEFIVRYGHATYEAILSGLAAETERVQLPQIVHVAEGHLFTHKRGALPASWSYLLAFGFEQGVYDQEHELIWLLAIADSPSAVTAESVAQLDEQLQEIQIALTSGPGKSKPLFRITRWAISKLGFTSDGTRALSERGFAASDYLQLELLTSTLDRAGSVPTTVIEDIPSATPAAESTEASPATTPLKDVQPALASEGVKVEVSADSQSAESADLNNFEMVIPVNDDKEIIAARAAERMARRAGFSPEAVNQLKTALIEACLSLAATEEVSEGKIYQRYQLDEAKMTITISNSAAGLDQTAGTIIPEDPERIWRMDVLQSLMDDVHLIKLADGWRIAMTRLVPQI